MIYDWKMALYWQLPVRLQEILLSLYAQRLDKTYYGNEYNSFKQWLNSSKNWSQKDTDQWISEQLQHIIRLAAKSVPYYRDKFKNYDWNKVNSVKDLSLLPMLEKHSLRQNEQSFLMDGLKPKSLWLQKTSGTTGTSLKIYWSKEMVQRFWAIMEVMVRHVAGVAREIPRAMMGGRPIIKGDAASPPYWRFNRKWKQLYFSSYHISKKTAPYYINALKEYGNQWLTGYGSAIAALAESALEAGIDPYPLKAVIVSGDTLLPNMRPFIEEFFQCKCFDHYGQSEGVAMAMECSHGKMHIIPMLGIIEIIDKDGLPCEPDEVGEIVATGLLNDAMPLIRYRIGDYAAWSEDQTCKCGNKNRIITKLEGRVDDYLLTSDNRKIGRLSTAIKRSPSIYSAQLVQDKPGHAFLLVRPGHNYISSHATAVKDDILERIGVFNLDIVEVSEIPKTPQGKKVLVVRLMDRPELKANYDKIIGFGQ